MRSRCKCCIAVKAEVTLYRALCLVVAAKGDRWLSDIRRISNARLVKLFKSLRCFSHTKAYSAVLDTRRIEMLS